MATEINAGRVAMVPKGEWSASTAYTRLDVVQHGGSAWVCIQDGTGQEPASGSTYWQLLAAGIKATDYYTKPQVDTALQAKQDALVSGQNIKSINGQSVLGTGNLELGELFVVTMTQKNSVCTADKSVSEIYAASYTNGKPVIAVMRDINNPVFILTDCDPDADSYVFSAIESNSVTTLRWQRTDDYTYELDTMVLQPHLVSGTNIKTVNNESLLGSGNVTIAGGEDGKSAYQSYVDTTTDSPVKTEAEWVASLKGADGVSLGEVAIADNLTTDDGTKVLSARQGVVLNNKALNTQESIDGITGDILSIFPTDGGLTNNAYSTNKRKYLIPLKNISTIYIRTSSANQYAFFKSWDFGTNTFQFATGYNSTIEVTPNDIIDFNTFPEDANYFYIEAEFVYQGNWAKRTFREFKLNGYDVLHSTVEHINGLATSIEGIQQNINTINSEITDINTIAESSVIVPETTITLTSGSTNNIFIYKSYIIKKGQRIRFELDGFGTSASGYRYYMNGVTYSCSVNPLEFIADQDYTLTRVAVLSTSILQDGSEVTFRARCVGYQDSLSELKETLNNIPTFVGLQTIQTAANVSGHVFTNSFEFDIPYSGYRQENCIIQCASKFITTQGYDITTSDVPMIKFNNGFNYTMSNLNDICIKEWRVIQPTPSTDKIHVAVTIPTGVQLIISDFSIRYSSEKQSGNLMIYSHGTMGGSNFNTLEAWNRAALCGAYGAIAVPKRTSDGVWVAYHDDGNVNVAMMYDNKSSIASGVTVNNSTYAETQLWRYGSAYKSGYNINSDGTETTDRIPKLEDFFKLCAKTGMHPCLSWHPYPDVLVDGHYRDFVEVKALADKYGITDKLCIKLGSSGASYLTDLHDVFGDSLEMVLVNVGDSTYSTMLGYLQNNGVDIFDKTKVKYGVEYSSDMDTASESVINQLVANGYIVGMCYVTDGKRMNWCLEHGITDYTLDVFNSWGLNW